MYLLPSHRTGHILTSCSMSSRQTIRVSSLQCRCISGIQVHIFVLDCHLGFVNCDELRKKRQKTLEGWGEGKFTEGVGVKKWTPPPSSPTLY